MASIAWLWRLRRKWLIVDSCLCIVPGVIGCRQHDHACNNQTDTGGCCLHANGKTVCRPHMYAVTHAHTMLTLSLRFEAFGILCPALQRKRSSNNRDASRWHASRSPPVLSTLSPKYAAYAVIVCGQAITSFLWSVYHCVPHAFNEHKSSITQMGRENLQGHYNHAWGRFRARGNKSKPAGLLFCRNGHYSTVRRRPEVKGVLPVLITSKSSTSSFLIAL